jgi:hypothetical protein
VSAWINGAVRSRWRDILIYAAAGLLTFEVLLPLGSRVFGHVPRLGFYQPWFLLALGALAVAVLAFIIVEPVRIRSNHWPHILRYPPLWFSPALAFTTALFLGMLPRHLQPVQDAPDWEHSWLVAIIIGAFTVAVSLRQVPWLKKRRHRVVVEPATDPLRWETLRDWSGTEEPTELDLFGHTPISTRITHTLLDESHEQAIALLGPFGSGKSSILARVRSTLEDSDDTLFVVAEFSGWAIPQAADSPRVALERMIDALSQFVDMQRFRDLPEAYKRLVAAEPSGLIAKILGTSGDGEPLAHLKRLESVLQALNARMVLFVEDADRAGDQFESRHLERLLMTLRDVRHVSFVLSIDGALGHQFDYRKLCDVIEVIPRLNPEHVALVLATAYKHWMAVPFIDPRPSAAGPLHLEMDPEEVNEYYRLTGDLQSRVIASALESPRRLKHLIRRVDRVWRNLAGEVDLNDLIIITALADGNRALFEFLVENIDALRQDWSG